MNTTERLQAAQRAEFEAMVGVVEKAIEGFEQLALLNLHTLRDATDEAAEGMRRALSARDAQELFADGSPPLQRSGQRAADYAQRVGEIAGSAQAGMVDAVNQGFALMQQLVQDGAAAAAGTAAKPAPFAFGADGAQAWFDNAMRFSTDALQAFGRSQQQAAQLAAAVRPRGAGNGAAKPAARAARS